MLFSRRSNHSQQGQKSSSSKTLVLQSGEKIIFNSRGLLPVIIQDEINNEVVHLGYMNATALNASLQNGVVYLFRRSSGQLEKFGENKSLEYKIKSVKLHSSKRSMLLTVHASDGSIHQSFFTDIIREPIEEKSL